ncbi:DUF6247 family protein [Sphaerisporangium sp. B11E5]|uniref:DUF6247 family protein n=1 Tax=Sphaerisporangium sp. B11E5 TaxID=3153563 RepID=UPI00325EECEF
MPAEVVESLKGDRSPRNIRDCLPGEHREVFERDFRRSMARAAEELDLDAVSEVLAYWWHVARMTATGEYQEVLEESGRLGGQVESGAYVPGRAVGEAIAERAAELGARLDL